MRYFFPCLLSVNGIDNSQIISISISNPKNNIFKECTITAVANLFPENITIKYNNSLLFFGELLDVVEERCGKYTAKYRTKAKIMDKSIYILPYWYFSRMTSPQLVEKVNNITGTTVFKDKTALIEQGDGGHPDQNPFYTFKWTNYYFFVDKASALNKNFWKDFDPVAQSSSADSIYQQHFGQLSDDQFAWGSCLVLYRKMVSGQTEWWTHIATIYQFKTLRFHDDTTVIVPKGTKYRNITFNCNSGYGNPPFCIDIVERDIKTTADLFKLPEINAVINTVSTGRLFAYVQVPKGSNVLEVIRRFTVNVSLKVDQFGEVIGTDVENIQNTYAIDDSVVFDHYFPVPVSTSAAFYFIDTDEETLRKYVRSGQIVGLSDSDEMIKIERDDVDFANFNDTLRIVKQYMLDKQKTGSIRTVLIPDLDLYHRIQYKGKILRVVGYSHQIDVSGCYTNMEVVEEWAV